MSFLTGIVITNFRKNNENCHACFSAKLRCQKMFSEPTRNSPILKMRKRDLFSVGGQNDRKKLVCHIEDKKLLILNYLRYSLRILLARNKNKIPIY